MAGYGYSHVTEKGFSAFAHDLNEGVWKEVSIKKYDGPEQKNAHLLDLPRPVAWKLRASWVIADLERALAGSSSEVLQRLDTEWDSAQRALNFAIATGLEHKDPAHREAAGRLHAALLAGSGAEQTGYRYDEEVDFGRHQISITGKGPLAADAKKVGLGEHLDRVRAATEALAAGLGREPGQKRAAIRSRQLRDAIAGCTATFNAIHDEIAWLLDHLPPGEQHEKLEALHAPFLALLDRYPPRSSAVAERKGSEAPNDAPEPSPLSA
jgi:hypothetical protein